MPKSKHYGWQKRWDCDVDRQTATHKEKNIRFVFNIDQAKIWWMHHKLDFTHKPTNEWIEKESQRMSIQDYQAHVKRLWYEAGSAMLTEYNKKIGIKYTIVKA